jgi:fructose-1-phosphate kinase PfkB-like protein
MPASCVVLSGSLPRGVKATTYAQLIGHARRAGVKSILDCDGEAFKEAVAAKPFLVKPNEHELAAWCGNASGAAEALGSAVWKLSGVTGGWVLASRGAKGGLLVNSRLGLEFSARPPCIKPVNTVGAGDAMAAAVARQIELGAAPQEWLRHGIAAGTSATKFPAGILPSFASIEKLAAQIKVV